MADGFLQRYSEELAGLRRRAARFAAAHPKIARRLRLSGEASDDPHVERLVQSFAFVGARVRQKLDDEFPELTGSLLETLYPHYLAPVPAMMILRFEPAGGLDSVQRIPRHLEILCEPIHGERCQFRTTQEVVLAPVTLTQGRLQGQPIEAPLAPHLRAASCLRLTLERHGGQGGVGGLGLSSLRFQITAPWREATALHELILNHVLGVALARHASDTSALFLPAAALRPVGFAAEEGMLPYPPNSFVGYRLLSEFFVLPQKFLAFEISGLEAWREDVLDIFIYLDQPAGALERQIATASFALNSTPAVNLFAQQAEPVTLTGERTEYALVPDSRNYATREVHSVTAVSLSDRDGQVTEAVPFFAGRGGSDIVWQLRRDFDPLDGTSEVMIAFVGQDAMTRRDVVASVDTLALNRDLPQLLPYGGGHPHLEPMDTIAVIDHIEALTAPTASLRFADDEERRWRLASHLNLNHLSLLDGDAGALREMLRLYVPRDRRDIHLLIEAIIGIESRRSMARISGGAMVPGNEIRLRFDPGRIDRGGAYLMASVLDRFFGLYTSINSFTRLSVVMKGLSDPLVVFPARYGERPLL
ncbi:MAG: type VI secretion system baseplate subunit TssF [Alphaproteobacteria bacterium]|nr:type VI secretion system baseplate subunit TssF [Alphaproteobacteria bacterium]